MIFLKKKIKFIKTKITNRLAGFMMGTRCVWFKGCEFNILFIRYLFNLLISVCSDNKRCGPETMFAADKNTFSSKIFSLIVDFFGCHDFFFSNLNWEHLIVRSHHYFFLNIFFLTNKFQFFTFDKIRYYYYGRVSVQLQNVRTEVEISNFNLEISNFEIRNYKVGIFNYKITTSNRNISQKSFF